MEVNCYKQTLTQEPASGRDSYGWRVLTARTSESWNQDKIASEVTIRATDRDRSFLDISITEYTGESRRAKMTHVRLQQKAVYALLVLLLEQNGLSQEEVEALQEQAELLLARSRRSSGRASK